MLNLPPKNTPRPAPPTPRHDRTAQLTALETGGLNALQRHLLLRHVANCPDCRAEQERIALLSAGLRALSTAPAPALALPVATPGLSINPLSRLWRSGNGLSLPKRAALVAAAALLITAGTVLTTLPGGPVRPTVAFARVEGAMRKVQTATWQERTYYPSKPTHKPSGDSTVWVRLDTPATLREVPPLTEGAIAGRHLTTPRGLVIYVPGGDHYTVMGDYPNGESGQATRAEKLRAAIRRDLIFPRDSEERGMKHTVLTPYKWRESPWESKKAVLDGAPVLCFTRRSALYRDDTPFWRKQKPRNFRETIYADPRTFLVVRREVERKNGVFGHTLTVSHGFRYNATPPPDTFSLPVPVGRTVLVSQVIHPGNGPVPAQDRRGAERMVRLLTDAKNEKNWDDYARLYDFAYAPRKDALHGAAMKRFFAAKWVREPYPLPAKTESEHRARKQENFRRGEPYRSWRIDGIDSIKYEGSYLYTRHTESDPFPPRTPPDTFAVRVTLTAITRTGKTEKRLASFTVRKTGTDFRVTEIRFVQPPKPTKKAPPS